MKISFFNNWRYKGRFNKFFGCYYNQDFFHKHHFVIGIFNFYFFMTWK